MAMEYMKKLFNLKKWLTIPETAKHLSLLFEEEVTEADVLRLGLDQHLKLSVYFVNHAHAICGKVVGIEDVIWAEFPPEILSLYGPDHNPDDIPTAYMQSLNIDNERFLNLDDKVITIKGVWDLPMIGAEVLDVEHRYQQITDGPDVTLTVLDGTCVEGTDGSICQLQELCVKNDYHLASNACNKFITFYMQQLAENGADEEEIKAIHEEYTNQKDIFLDEVASNSKSSFHFPAGGLPEDAVLVVRTSELRRFEMYINQVATQETNDQLGRRNDTADAISDENLSKSAYWNKLIDLVTKAVNEYKPWKKTQRRIQKTGNLNDWLKNTIGADSREAEIIKKVLTDEFNDL